ncbi:hypothetical protein GCM10010123_07370 [Pilimelia anulata]|uniref:Uncharacterized protein n=1 Tax=Pilimelia anulata TaxID=53371 RepID=A0A8J3F7T9_9ACTN|nr:hypothetical protein [Pilimelia anulata]GGJ80021.1 hypothetical protein GCM10010123_07370 [Pilimelia anulata]
MTTERDLAAAAAARARVDQQALWSVAVGFPALVSVLRLWVEAGGDLQTTLLLVANVGSINLVAALVVTAAWLAAAVLIAMFAVGQLTLPGLDDGPRRPWRMRFARVAAGTPTPLKVVVFAFAALTWQLLYLPVLLFAAAVVFGPAHWRWRQWAALGVGYALVAAVPLVDAVAAGEPLPALLLVAPAVLIAAGAARPVPAPLAPLFSRLAQAATAVLVGLAAVPVITAGSVLPLSVLAVDPAPGTTPPPGGPAVVPRIVRGHVVEVNDATTALLHEHGGVEFIPNGAILRRVLCPDASQTPRYRLWAYGIHLEDSVLQGLGRARRPSREVDPACRAGQAAPGDAGGTPENRS